MNHDEGITLAVSGPTNYCVEQKRSTRGKEKRS